ncbi:MAG: prepilin-type N-terminal cleavage/methylation domain-containing protein, partial [Fibrella sp.]|nr:prepilin-type N-terminal cleavage/methylation domain-containing protein [Armatimonadota bacterium]
MKRNTNYSHAISAWKRNTGASRLSVRAFTLVELLVVIAITSILLGLLFGPIISSFNLTRRARSISQAQDAARFGLERLTRELGRATYIYDNGLSPVAIPMAYDEVASQSGPFDIGDPTDPYAPSKWPLLAYARIDLVQPAVRQDGNDIIDPTTGQPIGGAELRPGVRGKRVTRYFLALRFPGIDPDTGNQRLYQNRYEFRRIDNDNNPVILYRAEYDPTDPNLFDLDAADYGSTVANSGGFNDPAFFYASKASDAAQLNARGTPANGRSYGENWRAIAQPVLVSDNVDLLRWNRVGAATNRVEKDRNDPFASTTTFAPVAVPDDVASPGFLTSGGVETPAAVPTLYQAKYAAWTYPYTINVLRGSTGYGSGRPLEPFGSMSLTVDRDSSGNVFIVNTGQQVFQSSGTLITNPANVYAVYSPTTRKLFVKTARLTFAVDADRGRIETAFPPLMGVQNGSNIGIPYYIPVGTNAATPVTPTLGVPVPAGELIPTFFSIDTRDPQAGVGGVPTNLGIFQADLFTSNYIPVQTGLGGTISNASPLFGFGEKETGVETRGVRIIPGSERLSAPVSTPLDAPGSPTSWSRVGALGSVEQQPSKFEVVAKVAPAEPRFTTVIERRPLYAFQYDFYPTGSNVPATQL